MEINNQSIAKERRMGSKLQEQKEIFPKIHPIGFENPSVMMLA